MCLGLSLSPLSCTHAVLDKISVGSLDSGGKGGRGAQPRALAGKQHTVLGFGRAMYFGWHRELEKLSGSQRVEMAMGGAEPLAREREAGASGNLLGAGAEAQADSCGEVVLGRGRRDRTLWR